jgi:hypothetical protein
MQAPHARSLFQVIQEELVAVLGFELMPQPFQVSVIHQDERGAYGQFGRELQGSGVLLFGLETAKVDCMGRRGIGYQMHRLPFRKQRLEHAAKTGLVVAYCPPAISAASDEKDELSIYV